MGPSEVLMRQSAGALLCAALAAMAPATSRAFDNDFDLSKLGNPETIIVNGEALPGDPLAQERFARFVGDLALAIAPLPAGLHSSLGEAGFELSLSGDVALRTPRQTLADGQASDVWPTESPAGGALFLPTLHLRKGLPFSFEIGTDFTYVMTSQMVVSSVSVKWAFLEGFQWWPDLAVRGFGTVLLGSGPLNLVVGGWDLGASYRFPILGGAEGGVYAGFQQIGVNATTTNIDFSPATENPDQPTGDDGVFASLPFGSNPLAPKTGFTRIYFGAQVRLGVLVIGADFATASGDNLIGERHSGRFKSDQWKLAGRMGVLF